MAQMLSTRDLADALGVSESSLRRWADDGIIRATKTAGGHRRIPLHEAIRFVRETRAAVVRPEKLGLPELPPIHDNQPSDTPQRDLYEAMVAGDDRYVIGAVQTMYLGGQSVASICDGSLRGVMSRVGELWQHDPRGIMVEHRATDICIRAINQLRSLLSPPDVNNPRAVGCAPTEDPYLLPTLMAAVVAAEAGMIDVNLGPHTPAEPLRLAIDEQQPRLVWIALTAPQPLTAIERYINTVHAAVKKCGGILVIGGRQAGSLPPHTSGDVLTIPTMAELSALARGLLAPHQPRARG